MGKKEITYTDARTALNDQLNQLRLTVGGVVVDQLNLVIGDLVVAAYNLGAQDNE